MLDRLIEQALELMDDKPRALLGIAGPPGSGKSTLAEHLTLRLHDVAGAGRVQAVPMDGFHLADGILERLGLRQRMGAPETFDAHGYLGLLTTLRTVTDRTVYAPSFHRDLEQPIANAIAVEPTVSLIITEGNYLLLPSEPWARVTDVVDQTWYCELDPDIRHRRLVDRHIRFGKTETSAADWVRVVDQANAGLVESTRPRADLVVDMNSLEPPGHVGARIGPTERRTAK